MTKKEKKEKRLKTAENGENGGGGGLLFAVVSLLSAILVIAAVLAGFLFMIVRLNVLGVADTYKDSIAKTPILNLALPKEEKTEPQEMTFTELVTAYETKLKEIEELNGDIDRANDRNEELSKSKSELDAQILISNERAGQLQEQVLALEANKKQLDDLKYELDRIVAAGDKEAFARYYEGVSPEIAQEIYAQIIQEEKSGEEKRQFIKLFETLDTKASAQIIETLGSGRIDFIADTLSSLKREIAAEIIGSLTPELGAQITLRLSGY